MKNGWKRKQLGELSDILDSQRRPITKRDRAAGKYPYYGATGIVDYVKDFIFDEPLVLVGEDGAKWASGENTAFRVDGKCWVNNHAHVLRPHSNTVLDNWLIYFLNHSDLSEFVSGLTVPKLNQGNLREIPVPVPPLPEQQRIVGILDEAFDGIATAKANAEKNLQNARALFESHLQSVFTKRGDGWVEKRLDEVCTFSSGGTPSKSNSSYWSGEIPWVSGRDMKSTRLSDSLLHISRSAVDESSTRMAPAGTLLILVRGMGLAHGAQIAELMVPCTFNQDIRGIHLEPDLIPRYLLFALRDRINSSDNVLSSAAHGTLKIDSDELKSVMVPVLSRGHQQRIVATIDSLSEEAQRLESIYQQKLAALGDLKKSLLHEAFTGQL